ncbi:MAG: c-type cytochrome [Acidobacteria bacterium]|nr:c-type cytochrome [Acidobacteriota bacterium]
MLNDLLAWIDDRTGLVSALHGFFEEEIPASSGWHQVFGSVAMFAIVTQFATGLLLAINYAPQPGEAWLSLQYIVTEVTAGRLIRGLHHFGASLAVIIVVLHMVQVALWGAYKKPREATWLAGVLLLLLTMAFGLTGYLLPWDNRSYWATVVTLQIASLPPVVGDWTLRVLGSQDGAVGAATFSRFYAAHTMLLPAITTGLMFFHVYLVRRHGVAPQPGDEALPKKKFWPEQVFKDTVAVFAVFGLLFGLAALVDVPLGQLADPTDTSFVPRPEWYFLFLFQMLKFFEGSLEIVGAVVLPGLAVTALALLPWIDRGKAQRIGKRVTAMGIVGFCAIGWTALTVAAIRSTPPEAEAPAMAGPPGGGDWTALAPAELAGYAYFEANNCSSCHNLAEGGPKSGPTLATMNPAPEEDATKKHVAEHAELSSAQRDALATFSANLEPDMVTALEVAPDFAKRGAQLYQENQCAMCHIVNGSGGELGPALDSMRGRHDADWLAGHFRDPAAFVEGSTMPPYPFEEADMKAIVEYLLSL